MNSEIFDFYIFATSLRGELCCNNTNVCPKSKKTLVPHGLWPSNSSSCELNKKLQYCSPISKQDIEIHSKYEFNAKKRLVHQFKKHGSCSTYRNINEYVNEEAKMMNRKEIIQLEAFINDSLKSSYIIPLNKIVNQVSNAAIITGKDCSLKEIQFCFDKNEDGSVGSPRKCPTYVLKRTYHNQCGSVFVQKPSTDLAHSSPRITDNTSMQCIFLSETMVKHLKK